MLASRLLFSILLASAALSQQTFFVNANHIGGDNSGSSWANACHGASGLKRASDLAAPNDRIFVAQGTYSPAYGTSPNSAIELKDGQEVFGGFLGNESSPEERPALGTVTTLLEGLPSTTGFDVNQLPTGVLIDRFAITLSGLYVGNSSGVVIRDCHFFDNAGCRGGAATLEGAVVTFEDCLFEDGYSYDHDYYGCSGAGIDADNSTLALHRCIFRDNYANDGAALFLHGGTSSILSCLFHDNLTEFWGPGGAITITGGSHFLTGCTIVRNTSEDMGAGIHGNAVVRNCILWGNDSNYGTISERQIYGSTNVKYSFVEGGFPGLGNISGTPGFVDANGDDFRLTLTSPCLDAGKNLALIGPRDLDFFPRRNDIPSVPDIGAGPAPVVDMGAYELGIGEPYLACLPLPNSTGEEALLSAAGSLSIAANDLTFTAYGMPLSQFGYFVMSQASTSLAVASGQLCVGAPQVRFNNAPVNSGPQGTASLAINLQSLPSGVTFSPGETWFFQLWYRDGQTSNFTSTVTLTWE